MVEHYELSVLQEALALMGIGVAIIGELGQIYEQNWVLDQEFDAIGDTCYKRYLAQDERCKDCLVIRSIQNNKPMRTEHKYANEHDYAVLALPLVRINGFEDRAFVIFVDITQQKKMEDQLVQAEKMDALGRMAAGIAHDFGNFLSIIGGYAELIRHEVEDDGIVQDLLGIQETVQRAGKLSHQLLEFSNSRVSELELFDINQMLRVRREMYGQLLAKKNAIFLYQLSDEPCNVVMDPVQFERIIVNLLSNAVDAIGLGGIVSVKTQIRSYKSAQVRKTFTISAGKYCEIRISDDGCGMSPETMGKIYEPFFTTKGVHGTGLGLSTAYGIIKDTKGYIEVESKIGVGSTFFVYLPYSSKKPVEGKTIKVKNPTILLVEDNVLLCRVIEHSLTSHGYRVIIVHTSSEALVVEEHYHILLTDIRFDSSSMSGWDLSRALMSKHTNLVVVYMSAYKEEQRWVDPGMRFLQKPFTTQQLVDLIGKIHDS